MIPIQRAWCAETSADFYAWTAENPALGQCAVTALVVQDFVGGDLLRAETPQGSHYWNRLLDGAEIDLTRSQFGDTPVLGEPEVRHRSYLLTELGTVRRYGLLRERMGLPGV